MNQTIKKHKLLFDHELLKYCVVLSTKGDTMKVNYVNKYVKVVEVKIDSNRFEVMG